MLGSAGDVETAARPHRSRLSDVSTSTTSPASRRKTPQTSALRSE